MTNKLLEKVKQNNRKAQKEFYDLYSEKLFIIANRYVKNEEDAASIVNYAFFKIFSNLSKFIYNNEKSLSVWMQKIIINEAISFLRKTNKYTEIYENESNIINSEDLYETSYDTGIYYEMIKQLPSDYRTVFNMYAIEGYKHKEISIKLNITESSSRVYLMRARKNLQEKLKNYEKQ